MKRELTVDKLIKQMDRLFITYRGKYLKQVKNKKGSTYITIDSMVLASWQIEEHLVHGNTIGVKLGKGGLTKFLTFDVDIMDEIDRKLTTIALVNKLRDYYGIPLEDIHVWYSGLKGYHVDLYFDDVISEKKLLPFYNEVLRELNEIPSRIERRPTTGMGVKLPLGIHLSTGELCFYVDNQTLEPLTQDYFLNIEPQSLEEFKENILDAYDKEEHHVPVTSTSEKTIYNKNQSSVDGQKIQKYVTRVLEEGHLLEPNSRNYFTYYASIILRGQGYASEDTFDIIFNIIKNTYNDAETRGYLDRVWTIEKLAKETRKVVMNTYEKDYKMSIRAKEITFYKQEIDEIMCVKKRHLRKLLFSLMRISKTYAKDDGVFFSTHEKLGEMGNDKNAGRSIKNIRELEQMGLVEIVQSAHYISDNKCAPNYYRILIEEPTSSDAEKVTYSTYDEIELRQVVKDLNPEIETNVIYLVK